MFGCAEPKRTDPDRREDEVGGPATGKTSGKYAKRRNQSLKVKEGAGDVVQSERVRAEERMKAGRGQRAVMIWDEESNESEVENRSSGSQAQHYCVSFALLAVGVTKAASSTQP